MILGIVLWLPIKVFQHFLRPATSTFETFADNTYQDLEDYIKETIEKYSGGDPP